MNIDGARSTNSSAMADNVINYFSDLYSDNASSIPNYDIMEQNVPYMVMDEENKALIQVHNEMEIRNNVFLMDGDSSHGPDRFTGKFYQHY